MNVPVFRINKYAVRAAGCLTRLLHAGGKNTSVSLLAPLYIP